MFPARIRLFSLLGFRISIDLSWFFLAFYLVLSLSTRYFPAVLPHLEANAYLVLGIIGALGLFTSIVLHELAHAVVARGFGLPISGITLFIFGGVAELKQEPKTPRSEFWVAIAGPIASIVIASACFVLTSVAGQFSPVLAALLSFLALFNTMLALFNLAPAFPLDGGRILRSIIWWRTGNLRRATRIAATFGSVLGVILMIWGVAQILSGSTASGTWQLLIGLFLTIAASQARTQTETSESLKGAAVADLMDRTPLTAPPEITIGALVNDYIYRLNRKFVIISEDGQAFGYVGPEQIKKVPQSQWQDTFVRTIIAPFTHNTAVAPTSTAIDALRKLRTNGIGHLAVLEGSRLLGTVSEANFANYLSVREELVT
jgi:Zn-dependent protease